MRSLLLATLLFACRPPPKPTHTAVVHPPSTQDEPDDEPAPAPAPSPVPSPAPAPAPAPKSTVTPEQFCAHVTKLLLGEGAKLDGKLKQQLGAGCITNAKKEQQSDPEGYACDTECVMAAKKFADVEACSEKCK